MSLTIRRQAMRFRKEDGTYSGADMLLDKTIDERISEVTAEGSRQIGAVTAEGTRQKNAIGAKGSEVLASIPSDYTALAEDVDKKAYKTRIEFDGTQFTLDGEVLNYKRLYEIHLTQPDFAFVTYGNRAYLLSYVQDDAGMKEMRFQSTIAVTGSDNLSNVKTSGIYVISNDGISIASVRVSDVNSENVSNKADEFTAQNKNSDVWYPSNKAVSNLIAVKDKQIAALGSRIENLEYAAKGYLYREETDSDTAYEKIVPADAMPWASVDKLGGKTVVWNQILENSNFATQGQWTPNGVDCTLSIRDGVAELILLNSIRYYYQFAMRNTNGSILTPGHVHLLSFDAYSSRGSLCGGYFGSTLNRYFSGKIPPDTWTRILYRAVVTDANFAYIGVGDTNAEPGDVLRFRNMCVYDLTAMFGAGNEPTAEEFCEMFPADYYPYAAPQLMSYSADKVVSSSGAVNDYSALAQKYFPDGMKSVGNVYDEIDLERGVAVQRVGSVDLGTLNWSKTAQSGEWWYFNASGDFNLTHRYDPNTMSNSICAKYPLRKGTIGEGFDDGIATFYYSGMEHIRVYEQAYSSVDEFKLAMTGVKLYYELETPTETLIDPADLAGLADVNVEAGGTLTFANDHGDDYRVPLPNQETFMIKLGGAAE